MAPSRQMKRILDMLAEIIERLERLENGGESKAATDNKKPAAKISSK